MGAYFSERSRPMDITVSKEELEAGRGYEKLFVPALFGPWTRHVIDAAELTRDNAVLDLACGSGVLARHVFQRLAGSGRVVGVDPAPGMITTATEHESGIEWVHGSAEDLVFDDATFDRVVSQFGMMFFQDRDKAVREMYRVLKSGGRLTIAVWDTIKNNPTYGAVAALLSREVSQAAGDAIRLPYNLGDVSEVTGLLANAGFSKVKFETRTEQAHFPNSRTMVEAELRGWLPLFDIRLDEEKIADVLTQSDGMLSEYVAPSGEVVFPTSAHIVTARKPT